MKLINSLVLLTCLIVKLSCNDSMIVFEVEFINNGGFNINVNHYQATEDEHADAFNALKDLWTKKLDIQNDEAAKAEIIKIFSGQSFEPSINRLLSRTYALAEESELVGIDLNSCNKKVIQNDIDDQDSASELEVILKYEAGGGDETHEIMEDPVYKHAFDAGKKIYLIESWNGTLYASDASIAISDGFQLIINSTTDHAGFNAYWNNLYGDEINAAFLAALGIDKLYI